MENNILTIENYHKIAWLKLTHEIIYNSINIPEYFKKLLKLKEGRNGLTIKTEYRESKYGNKISYNIMEQYWNNINPDIKRIPDKLSFYENINKYLNGKK